MPDARLQFTGGMAPPHAVTAHRASTTVPVPGPDAPPGMAVLHDLLQRDTYTADDLDALAHAHPAYWLPMTVLAATTRYGAGDLGDVTQRQLRLLFDHAADPATHPFFATHLAPTSHVALPIAPGVTADMPFSRDAIGLMLVDVYRAQGRIDLAIEVAQRLTPSHHSMVSLVDLHCRADDNGAVLRLTNGVRNDGDVSALLLVYRGIACARTGLYATARQAFNDALSRRRRAPQIRHFALEQRAELHAGAGRNAMARRDLERVIDEGGATAHVRERLAALDR